MCCRPILMRYGAPGKHMKPLYQQLKLYYNIHKIKAYSTLEVYILTKRYLFTRYAMSVKDGVALRDSPVVCRVVFNRCIPIIRE